MQRWETAFDQNGSELHGNNAIKRQSGKKSQENDGNVDGGGDVVVAGCGGGGGHFWMKVDW